LMYSQFFICLDAFLLSLYLSLLAVRRRSVPLHALALAFSLFNLLTTEYFYFLEFARLGLLWFIVEKPKVRRVAISFSPYFALWLGVTLWRIFFFPYQTTNYKYVAIEQLKASPFLGIWNLLTGIFQSFWESVPKTWLLAFGPIDFSTLGQRTAILTIILALFSILALGMILFQDVIASSRLERRRGRGAEVERLRATLAPPARAGEQSPVDGEALDASFDYVGEHSAQDLLPGKWPLQAIALGAFTWLAAGGSFWLVGILPKTEFNGDRFLMPFMLGSSLILAGLIGLLGRWPRAQITLIALIVGFSISHQFQTANNYRRDWATQKTLFWQMTWRMPNLQVGTTILSNDLPVTFYSDNSLTGPLNWIYGREPGQMDYIC